MNQLIPVMNKIQDAIGLVHTGFDLNLPQIVVVGGQSVGKSSILEGLVGRAFLPTGAGVVTRRPLLLRLSNTADTGDDREFGEFSHMPGVQYEDFMEVRDEIVKETERVCGKAQVISPEPIVLKISSPHVIDLTLIDLPGITRVPVGDQPLDIEEQIRAMIMGFITNPSSIILAIVAGNADLATADALALSREVDPTGDRTIGVVTKLDLVDHGVDLLPVLDGRVYPLKLGFIGIVCRSFKDVQSKKLLREQRHTEEQFFKGHPAYRSIASRSGMTFLETYLNRILLEHICEALPEIKAQVEQLVVDSEIELEGYGENVVLNRSEQGALLLSLFTKFAGRFGDAIEGKISSENDHSPGQLIGRARIDFIFRDVFARTVSDFDAFSGLSNDDIRVAIQNATGPRATLFVPEAAFELLVKRQISKLQAPSLECADLVFEELQRVVLMAEVPEFRRFGNLREQIFGVVSEILRGCLEPASKMIKDLIHMELAYINTSHPDFVGSAGALAAARKSNAAAASTAGKDVPQAALDPRALPAEGATTSTAVPLEAEPQPSEALVRHGFFSNLGLFRSGPSRKSTAEADKIDIKTEKGPLRAVDEEPEEEDDSEKSRGRQSVLQHAESASSVEGAQQMSAASARSSSLPPRTSIASTVSSAGPLLERESSKRRSTGGSSIALKLPQIPQAILPAAAPPTTKERVEVDIIKSLLANYMSIVKKNIADSVPKVVMHFMVNNVKDTFQRECVARLYKEDYFDMLLQEARDMAGRRKKCQERLKALRKVIDVFEQVRNLDF
mmetsp:Transcript_43307/g.80748  ORF Transcript_43307/g.80748 Transcript_43307/m.80748 type:complete len:789 (-) Transcript_43307:78-2444(-)